ncbi:ribonuclease P protein component [Candidatus Peregrinibacteria bacterium CG10_big_fil_rev_8_21_14_0_10_36_19]|nr:MAG: ribonuclease P protein component [Candidatus Peregrinibacteria bacterium CG10_big_fil_rev_8_21_14_0_10_36_19]
MIAQKFRIPKEHIPYLMKKGEEKASDLFIIRYAKNDQIFCRYRTIVSKKIEKEAVDRNKLRRQIYEAARNSDYKSENGYDILLIPKKQILKKSFQDIQKDLCSIKF